MAAPSAGFRLKVLLRNLQGPGAGERLDAARLLNTEKQGSSAAFLADALRRDSDWQVRKTAAKALGALGAASKVDELLAALGDASPFVREAAAEAVGHLTLGTYGVGSRPVQVLNALQAALLHDRISFVRSAACSAIRRLAAAGAKCGQCCQALEDALLDEAWQVRWNAAKTLAFTGAEQQVTSLAACLRDKVWLVRLEACASLGMLGALSARDALERALRSDSDSRVREEAAKSLAAIGKSARQLGESADLSSCADALAAALQDEEIRVRSAAIAALGSQAVAAREHASSLVEQLLTGDHDIRAAVFRFFQEATSHAGTRLLAAAFDDGKHHQVRPEVEEIMAWSKAIARPVLRVAQDLRAASHEARHTAERHLWLLGPAAGICLVNEVIKAKDADYPERMATIRGLISCFTRSEGARLPPDLACAALSEWIYEPSLEHLPVPGLELVKLQTPEEHHGINLQWAVLRDVWGSCYVVFRGSETVLDWTENSYLSLRRVSVPSWQGVLLLHSGFWSTAEAESLCLLEAIREASAGVPFETLILCGGSKGGANALAAAIQWSVSHAELVPEAQEEALPCREMLVVTFGAPNIVGRGSGKPETTRALHQLHSALQKKAPRSRAWSFFQDPVPALMSARSRQVISHYHKGSRYAMGALRRIMPEAYKKVNKYLKEAVRVTATFQPVLPEAWLEPPPGVRGSRFQASVHPQRNYTEALCRRLLNELHPNMLQMAWPTVGVTGVGKLTSVPRSAARPLAPKSTSIGPEKIAAACFGLSLTVGERRRYRGRRVQLRPFRRDLTLDGYPVHGNGYYWTLSACTEAVIIYIPIADDVKKQDVVFSCREGTLKAGLVPEKGGLVINDKVLYEVDVSDSYYTLDDGEYGERCLVIWLEKRTREQNWYAYDRFEPVSERFLLQGEKKKADLKFEITQKCFFDIEIDDKKMGRIVFGLYGDTMPRTVENFKCLCTGEKGTSEHTGEPLHYKGTRFHRVIPGFCVQGGQTFENEEGSGGESIYGPTFEDENLRVKFKSKGLIAMANGGPNTNGSQFFITTAKAEHLNFKSVGFGEVLDGYEVVKAIESIGTVDGEPEENAVIVDCGTLEFEEGEQERLRNRRTQGGVDLTLRNEMIERVRGATAQGL